MTEGIWLSARYAVCVFLAAGLIAQGCWSSPSPPPRPRRIVLVSMDTVGASHVSGFSEADTMPELRAIAASGALFRRFYAAASYTLPAHMSMLTGLDVAEHGVRYPGLRLRRGIPTLASLLREAGYRTRGFHEGGLVLGGYGFKRGFDAYSEEPRGAVVGERLGRVLGWMREQGDTPYFLFLHTYAAHFPYDGLERYRAEHPERGLPTDAEIADWRERYGKLSWSEGRAPANLPLDLRRRCTLYNFLAPPGGPLPCGDRKPDLIVSGEHAAEDKAALVRAHEDRIRVIDRALAEIRRALVEQGEWQDTLLVVTADHGEAFWENGLQGHEFVPFETVLRIPLVVSFPRLFGDRGGLVVDGLAWQLDLVPTLLRLAGVETPEKLRGMDLTPALLQSSRLSDDRGLFPSVLAARMDLFPQRRAALSGSLKLIQGHAAFGDADGLLFDLKTDPTEQRNVRLARAEDYDGLRASLRAYRLDLKHTAKPAPTSDAQSERRREELRALGYVD